MNKHEHDSNQHDTETAPRQERRTRHETPTWVKRYLDLADQAITGNSSESSGQN